jgi:cyclopropane fatty-acyl-phospholipid synthase-like methyltransferase
MEDRWYVIFWRRLQQAICIHFWTHANLPGEPAIQKECFKCGKSVKDFEAESAMYHNLSSLWYYRFLVARDELAKYDPIKANSIVTDPLPERTEGI